jgi:hypothetical protein
MKQKSSGLAEVQVDAATSRALAPRGFGTNLSAVFVVDLPEGARVSVPAGFDADEVFNLLLVVREALR